MKILEKINKDINRISPYSPGKPIEEVSRELGLIPENIIKLASNESALGVSPRALAAMRESLSTCFRYPDGSAHTLRNKIAVKYNLQADQVILGNGSNEILQLIGHCFLNRKVSSLFSRHSFVVYKLVSQLFGARMIEVPMTKDLTHDVQRMIAEIADDTAVIFICNPNNPTGTFVDASTLFSAIDAVPDDVLVVVDEAYSEVALCEMPDTLSYLSENPNLIVCRTFSKGYGLAGLRIGYGLGAAPLIDCLQRARQPFNVNLLAQVGAIAALDDDDFICKGKETYRQGKELIENACRDLKLEFIPTTANFMMIDVGNGSEITRRLMKEGVIVRSMEGYDLPQYIRVTFGTQELNERFLTALKLVL